MFSEHDWLRLKKTFSDFSLDAICRTTHTDLPALYRYLEYYGFLYTLKGLGVEYYCGYRRPSGRAGRRGRVATYYWRLNEAKGTVFLVHGLFDHTGLYQPAVRYFLEQGFSVVSIDLPGHGLSDGEPTVISSFDNYGDVLADTFAYFRSRMQGAAYAVGQSTGGAVILNHCFRAKAAGKSSPYTAIILLAPLLRPSRWHLINITYTLFAPIMRNIRRTFVDNSHDESFNHFLLQGDVMQSHHLSVRWIGAMRQWVSSFPNRPELNIPACIIQGTNDRVVDWRYNLPKMKAKLPNAQLCMVDEAMHHLVNESAEYRRTMVKSIGTFLSNLPTSP